MTTTPATLELKNLTQRYRDVVALDDVSVTVRPGTITGLVGRNGAGKTTLLAIAANLFKATSGEALLNGESISENENATEQICLMRDKGGILEDSKIRTNLKYLTELRPNFDRAYCEELLDTFGVPTNRKPEKLSRGQRSALSAAVGLATRAPLTIFDEVYLGMDAVARRTFYDLMLADYTANPRTIILSSHLLDEVEDLMEDVIVLNRGRISTAGDTDTVRAQYSDGDRLATLTDVLVAVSKEA